MSRVAINAVEANLEACVSKHIRNMPFVVLSVGDPSGPNSMRGFIERNAIALLSGWLEPAIDPPSRDWLGRHSDRERARRSGLWNNEQVDEACNLSFLDTMEEMIDKTKPL